MTTLSPAIARAARKSLIARASLRVRIACCKAGREWVSECDFEPEVEYHEGPGTLPSRDCFFLSLSSAAMLTELSLRIAIL
jgi:hypothetical protein